MRWYWTRILLGALGIFVIGYGIVHLTRAGMDRGRSIFATDDPISIPLRFIPFSLDGQEVGRFQRVTIRRDAPKVIAGLDVQVQVGQALPDGLDLSVCRVTTADRRTFRLDEGFTCVPADQEDSSLVAFGSVRFRGPGGLDATVPLLLDSGVVAELRAHQTAIAETRARLAGEAARLEADRLSTELRQRAQSLARTAPSRMQPAPPPPP